jgi:hypothetical protein
VEASASRHGRRLRRAQRGRPAPAPTPAQPRPGRRTLSGRFIQPLACTFCGARGWGEVGWGGGVVRRGPGGGGVSGGGVAPARGPDGGPPPRRARRARRQAPRGRRRGRTGANGWVWGGGRGGGGGWPGARSRPGRRRRPTPAGYRAARRCPTPPAAARGRAAPAEPPPPRAPPPHTHLGVLARLGGDLGGDARLGVVDLLLGQRRARAAAPRALVGRRGGDEREQHRGGEGARHGCGACGGRAARARGASARAAAPGPKGLRPPPPPRAPAGRPPTPHCAWTPARFRMRRGRAAGVAHPGRGAGPRVGAGRPCAHLLNFCVAGQVTCPCEQLQKRPGVATARGKAASPPRPGWPSVCRTRRGICGAGPPLGPRARRRPRSRPRRLASACGITRAFGPRAPAAHPSARDAPRLGRRSAPRPSPPPNPPPLPHRPIHLVDKWRDVRRARGTPRGPSAAASRGRRRTGGGGARAGMPARARGGRLGGGSEGSQALQSVSVCRFFGWEGVYKAAPGAQVGAPGAQRRPHAGGERAATGARTRPRARGAPASGHGGRLKSEPSQVTERGCDPARATAAPPSPRVRQKTRATTSRAAPTAGGAAAAAARRGRPPAGGTRRR